MSLHPTVGRIVLVALPDTPDTQRAKAVGAIRPAIIVRTWNPPGSPSADMVNLMVFTDGSNDGQPIGAGYPSPTAPLWLTSVHQHQPAEGEPQRAGTWSWMPYQVGQAAKTEDLQRQLDAK